jgi:hypothetical protein
VTTIQLTLLEGVSRKPFEKLFALLASHDESVDVRSAPDEPADEIEWLGPASVQVDTYWLTQFMDAMLSNIQEGTADEDIQDALIAALEHAWLTPKTWFTPYGAESNPLFRLRAFIEAHRVINYTIPASVRRESLRHAIETLGDGIAYSTDVESAESLDGMVAGVTEIDMVFGPEAEMWMEGRLDDDEYWDEEDEEDEVTF